MQIFSGMKVLELASVLAGPSVGQFFAELGAEVIKIENSRTNGDVTRSWKSASEAADSDISAYFSCANWGKKSVVLDLQKQEHSELVHQLSTKADIVLASYKPGAAEKLQMDYATLSTLNPKLIYGQITGYGPDNPRAGYDAVIQAESGFMYINGEAGGPPVKMPVALIDVLAAHQLKEGILAALFLRERTGQGQLVQVSLIEAALSALANQATNYLVAGLNPQRIGSEHPNIVPYGTVFYAKQQQPLVLAIGDNRQFCDLCTVLNITFLASDDRFKTNQQRVKYREELKKLLQAEIVKKEREELLQLLHERHVPAGAVYSIPEVFAQPEAQPMLLNSANKHEFKSKGVRQVAFRMAGEERVPQLIPPPHLGQHNEQFCEE